MPGTERIQEIHQERYTHGAYLEVYFLVDCYSLMSVCYMQNIMLMFST